MSIKKLIRLFLIAIGFLSIFSFMPVNTYAGTQESETAAEEGNGVLGEITDLANVDPKQILFHGSLNGAGGDRLDKDLFTSLKSFTSSLNLNLQKIGVGLAFVMIVFCFAYMTFSGNAPERADQKARVMRICIYVWILCSYVTLMGFVIDFAKSFR